MSGGFPNHKNTFQIKHTSILTVPRQEKTPIGLGQREKKMCRLVIVECGVRLWRMSEGKWESGLSVNIIIIIIIISFM